MAVQDTKNMEQWRVITPILLMILAGIMTFTATMASTYLSQINGSIQSIGTDLKSFTKETSGAIGTLDKRVSILEQRRTNRGE